MNIPNIPGRRQNHKQVEGKRGRLFKWEAVDWDSAGLVWAFLIPVMVMLVLFVIRGIFPFGERSFLFSDMYHQYMPFFSEFLNKIKSGEGLSYSYNVGIGSNFLALYVYYLASPLHWLAFLFPEKYLMEFMSYLVIVKIGLCGLTANLYLRERYRTTDFAILFFSCFYALSGFMAAYNWNIMWLDCVVLAPVVLMGLERLVKEGRCGLYCVSLGFCIFTNYYISIMVCIFLVLYFLVLLLTEKRSLKILWNFALYSLLAGGMAAVLLVPEVCAILETDFGDMNFPEKLESYFSVLDMLARHCLCVTTERGLEHWPNIYCGVAVFLLLPMFALNQRIPMRRRFGYLGLAGFMLVSFSTNMLDFIWHGMNYPDSLPARQSFLYILLALVMCYEAYREMENYEEKQILYGYLAAVVFLLCCEKFIDSEDFDIGIELLTLGFVTVYAVLLYLYRTRSGVKWHRGLAAAALLLVISEIAINTYNTSVGTTSRTQYLGQQADYKALEELAASLEAEGTNGEGLNGEGLNGEGKSFYRIEKFTRKTKNDGTLTGYATASVFSSTMNSYVADLYKRWGMRYSKVYYGFDGATAFTSALLNVKYMFGENQEEGGYLYELLDSSGDISLYRCNAALPFGYVAPTGYDLPEGFAGQPLRLQNRMVAELGITEQLFVETDCTQSGDDVKLTAPQDGYYYMVVTASGTKKIEVSSASGTRSFGDLKNGSVLYLGWLEEGQRVTAGNGSEDDDTQKISVDAYVMQTDVLEEALAALAADSLSKVSYDSTHVSGEITLEKEGRMILSIPYEEGWTVLVDGEETVPELFGGTLMAFDLQPGTHEISMSYVPKGKYAGILVSAVSVTVFVLLQCLNRKKKRQEPEGQGMEGQGIEGQEPTEQKVTGQEADGQKVTDSESVEQR